MSIWGSSLRLRGALTYKGTWNATTNSPALSSGVGNKGDYYVVSVSGSTNLDGVTDWVVGDWVIFNGTAWEKADHTDLVSSVNGYVGAVVLVSDDLDLGSAKDASIQTTDATPTEIHAIDVSEGEAVSVSVDVIGHQTDQGNRAVYKLHGLFYRNTAGNVTQQGNTVSLNTIESDTDWDVDLIADTINQKVSIQVTGKAGTTIDWHGIILWHKEVV